MTDPSPLSLATETRSRDARERAESALRALHDEGRRISFAAVAKRAEVSRAFLYANPELKAAIETLRESTLSGDGAPASERASTEALRARVNQLRAENAALRSEASSLREELALAHGRSRELEATVAIRSVRA